MRSYFLWVQAWPYYLATFPFDRFDQLESEDDILAELTALAVEWDQANPGAVQRQREEDARRMEGQAAESRAKDRGQPSLPDGAGWMSRRASPPALPSPPLRELRLDRADGFNEVASLAGWVPEWKRTVVIVGRPRAHLPEARRYFLAVETSDRADTVLATLRLRLPQVDSPPRKVGMLRVKRGAPSSPPAVLRYGRTSGERLSLAQVLDLKLRIEDLQRTPGEHPPWLGRVVQEASRVLAATAAHVPDAVSGTTAEAEPKARPEQSARVASEKANRAALAYKWMVEEDPELVDNGKKNYSRVHNEIKKRVVRGECPLYRSVEELPSAGSFERYAREGRRDPSKPSRSPRAGREYGSSIVRSDEI